MLRSGKSEGFSDTNVVYPELSFQVCGALFDAHNKVGRFCNEKQYSDAIEEALKNKGLKYEREKILPISFDGENKGRNIVDFLIDDKIILEIKAKQLLTRDDYYQTKRYLIALNKKLAILVNMRKYAVIPKRILNSQVDV